MAGKHEEVKEAGHDEGLLVALPNGSGWNIHVDENGKVELEGPIVLVS